MEPREFYYFSRLPLELRILIWRIISNIGRTITIICDDRSLNWKLKIANPMPGILLATRESRGEALNTYEVMTTVPISSHNPNPLGRFYVNFAEDSFHFKLTTGQHTPGGSEMRINYCLIRYQIDVWMIQELTIGFSTTNRLERDLNRCIQFLPGLEKLSIVVKIESFISYFHCQNEDDYSEFCRHMLEGNLRSDWEQERRYVSNNEELRTLEQEFIAEARKIADLDIHVIPEMQLFHPEQTVTDRWVSASSY